MMGMASLLMAQLCAALELGLGVGGMQPRSVAGSSRVGKGIARVLSPKRSHARTLPRSDSSLTV
ncbi:hypothetical protein PF008_g10192 [Phytophthora fragariae]|uniref:RxLR effector protein n=1 Tax=Phytophthora fragariae TaxID=53985 RepID=A0A6G0RUK1_9STRA|nr:hypothetical protein PF008_g10192 [Phytophthora fragariae]